MGSAAVTGGTQANSCTLWRLSRHAQMQEGAGGRWPHLFCSTRQLRFNPTQSQQQLGQCRAL